MSDATLWGYRAEIVLYDNGGNRLCIQDFLKVGDGERLMSGPQLDMSKIKRALDLAHARMEWDSGNPEDAERPYRVELA